MSACGTPTRIGPPPGTPSGKPVACIIPADDELYGVAVKKGDKETLDLINKGLEAVVKKGLDKEILKKWLGSAD